MERIDTLKAFVAKEKNTMKSFNDPKNIEKHKWYIKESLTNMKGEMLREIDGLLQDKRVTLMRQYNNHNDSLRREITELENERKEIYNFKFNDGAIMKNAKVRSFLAQEFRDLKARLSKKSFKDNKPKSQREVWLTGLSSIKDSLKRFKDENWSEGKHKRDKNGKFSSTGNGGESVKESGTVSKPDVKSLAKSKDKKEVKKVAKAYWNHFLSGVDDLVDWAGEDEDLRYYAEDGDIEGMAEIMANSKGGRETAIEALNDMEEDELNDISEYINDATPQIPEGSAAAKFCREAIQKAKKSGKTGDALVTEAYKILMNEYPTLHPAARNYISEHINDSAEHINDRKIDIKRDGKLIDVVNAGSLDEAVRIYERQHPELRGQIDAYFSDGKMKDARSDMMEELGEQYDMGVQSKRQLVKILMKEYNVSELQARQTVERFARDLKEMDLPIRDSLSEKAKQLISKAVAEARFDYKTAMDFAVADLKAEKEWAWTNQAEVSQMVQRLIKNRMDFNENN